MNSPCQFCTDSYTLITPATWGLYANTIVSPQGVSTYDPFYGPKGVDCTNSQTVDADTCLTLVQNPNVPQIFQSLMNSKNGVVVPQTQVPVSDSSFTPVVASNALSAIQNLVSQENVKPSLTQIPSLSSKQWGIIVISLSMVYILLKRR